MLDGIDGLPGTPEERAEAKGLLRQFLEHPLVKNISGGLIEIISSQAKTDIELVDLLWEKSAYQKPGDWRRRLSILKVAITELEARLGKAPPAELFVVASQLRERYKQYLECGRDAYASSPPYQEIKKQVIAGLQRIERLSEATHRLE